MTAATSYVPSTVKRIRRTNAELTEVDDAIIAAVIDEHPVTLRGVYYRVVSAGAVDKTEQGYRLVGRQLLKLRRDGRVPYSWITDGTRWISKPDSYSSADAALDMLASSYRRISGVIYPITARWDVPLAVLRGYCSESFAYSIAEDIAADRRPAFCYGLGDHDPSGVDAWRDLREKVGRFAVGADITFERIAVTPEQIELYELPTRPTKHSDTRAAGFAGESVEVDALPPTVLRRVVEQAITGHINERVLNLTRTVEAEERDGLEALAGRWLR